MTKYKANNFSMSKFKFIYYGALVLINLLLFYIFIPAINLHNFIFDIYLVILVALIVLPFTITKDGEEFKNPKLFLIPILMLLIIFGLICTSFKFFRSKDYSKLINPVVGNFHEDINAISYNKIPIIDRDMAEQLGNKKMGELAGMNSGGADLVSQFEVSPNYSQINVKSRPVRVTPLVYNGFFKWLNNFRSGISTYIQVDMINGNVNMVPIEGNMKYSKSDKFFRDVSRHIRFKYPFDLVGSVTFEVDDEGVPYWISPVFKKTIGWFGGEDVEGAILVRATDGETKKYELKDIPTWVDRVFPSEMVLRQLDNNGMYKSGWWNSRFGQKGVLQTTKGYNYLALGDDVYLYTGITSVASDSANLGFVLVNLRTKDTKFYPISSADEYSAMHSAEGAVQEKEYIATFPLLLNIYNRPVYCLALKDRSSLVKMYAIVDAQNFQITAVGDNISDAIKNYNKKISAIVGKTDASYDDSAISDKVKEINAVVIEGHTFYYFTLAKDDFVYIANINVNDKLPFVKSGDKLKIMFEENANVRTVIDLEVVK